MRVRGARRLVGWRGPRLWVCGMRLAAARPLGRERSTRRAQPTGASSSVPRRDQRRVCLRTLRDERRRLLHGDPVLPCVVEQPIEIHHVVGIGVLLVRVMLGFVRASTRVGLLRVRCTAAVACAAVRTALVYGVHCAGGAADFAGARGALDGKRCGVGLLRSMLGIAHRRRLAPSGRPVAGSRAWATARVRLRRKMM